MADTRKDRRAPVSLKVRFKSGSIEEFIEQYSVDVSRGGLFIKSKTPMAIGTLLKFELQLKDESRLIHGVGRVAWTRSVEQAEAQVAPPGMGIKFIKIDPDSRSFVERVVKARGSDVGTFDLGQTGSARAPGARADYSEPPPASFFPPGESPQPAPEDRTNVRHASEFLETALAGTSTAADEARANAEKARKRSVELAAQREADARQGAESARAQRERRAVMGAEPQLRLEGTSVEERAMKAAEVVPSRPLSPSVPSAEFALDDEVDEPTRIAPFTSGSIDLAALEDDADEPTRIAPLGDMPVASVFPLVGDALDVGDPSVRYDRQKQAAKPAPGLPPLGSRPQARAVPGPPAPPAARKATMRWDPAAAAALAANAPATTQAKAPAGPAKSELNPALPLEDDDIGPFADLERDGSSSASSLPSFATEMEKPAFEGALPVDLPDDLPSGASTAGTRQSFDLVGPPLADEIPPRSSLDILAPAAVEEPTPAVGLPAMDDPGVPPFTFGDAARAQPMASAPQASGAARTATRGGSSRALLWVGVAVGLLVLVGVGVWSLSNPMRSIGEAGGTAAPAPTTPAAVKGPTGPTPPTPAESPKAPPPQPPTPEVAGNPDDKTAPAEPPSAQPDATQPDATQPDATQPGKVQPGNVQPGNVALTIHSNPPTAEVFQGRHRVGVTPITIEVPVGKPIKLTVRRSGKVLSRDVTPSSGQTPITFDFVTKPFAIQFFTDPPGAKVRSAGRHTRTPGRLDWDVFPNAVAVRISLEGYEEINEVVRDSEFAEQDGVMVYRFSRKLTPASGGKAGGSESGSNKGSGSKSSGGSEGGKGSDGSDDKPE